MLCGWLLSNSSWNDLSLLEDIVVFKNATAFFMRAKQRFHYPRLRNILTNPIPLYIDTVGLTCDNLLLHFMKLFLHLQEDVLLQTQAHVTYSSCV